MMLIYAREKKLTLAFQIVTYHDKQIIKAVKETLAGYNKWKV